jgi:nudix-type nucleoside diphosphatase (YffH/AdpP family)
MSGPRKVEIRKQTRLFDDFFKVDEVIVSHQTREGTMSPDQRRLVFERGDAVAIILYNADSKSVIVVDQFKVPSLIGRRRDNPRTMDGWVTEATAGMIDPGESAETAIKRETMEETGYAISNPQLICKFFSSAGGSSERIFLYFAEVRDSDRIGEGGGLPGEDITDVSMPLETLFKRLVSGEIDDPKLAIGAYWLKDRLKADADRDGLVQSLESLVKDLSARLGKSAVEHPKPSATVDHAPPTRPRTTTLGLSTVCYRLTAAPDLIVGYKTGPIDNMTGVSIWVNSENTDMLMDRVIGRSISSRIRLLGANRDAEGNVLEDTIAEGLRAAVGARGHVKIGTVLVTESGSLEGSHQVERILHVATVQASIDGGVKASLETLGTCVRAVLDRVEKINKTGWNLAVNFVREHCGLKPHYCESILIPIVGAGDGGLAVEDVARSIIPAAVDYLDSVQLPTLKKVFFIAYSEPHRNACEAALQECVALGKLVKTDCK